jgi:leucyl aminopeptidase
VTTLTLTDADPTSLKADALVIGVGQGPRGLVLAPGAEPADLALNKRLRATLMALGATGKAGEVHKVATFGATSAAVVVAVGLGQVPTRGASWDAEVLRRAAGDAARALAGSTKVVLALPATEETVGVVAEGALLGAYSFGRYRTKNETKSGIGSVTIIASRSKATTAAIARAEIVAEAVCLTRDLVNTPPSDLHPKEFADAALAAAKGLKIDIEVLDEKALKRGGYGGILAVGQGSANPPRLVRLSYTHPRAKKSIAFVGKGITFDSGGLSLKPPTAMETMKCDMGGAAAVLAAVTAIAKLKLPVNVTGWAPLAENMPSGSAQRPSDVFTTYGGKTVEVLNTDAEGRLVLADALERASEEGPDIIVDVATLTGAAQVALGNRTAGVMGNDDELRAAVCDAAKRAGEQMWPMPLPVELRASLDSTVADLSNVGERMGGMLVAGLFLKEFIGSNNGTPIRWAHLDIAGPAFNVSEPFGYTPKGGTGAAVRTLVQLAEDVASGAV